MVLARRSASGSAGGQEEAEGFVRIENPDDLRVASYRNIRERDLHGRDGLFVAEGKVVVDVLLSGGTFQVHSLLILENRLEGMRETISRVPSGVPVYVTGPEVMNAIAGFDIHRGVLAMAVKPTQVTAADRVAALGQHATLLVLSALSNHDNVGAIFRNAAAFGVDLVLLDQLCCDPLYRKSIRVSAGHVLRVPFAHEGSIETLIDLLEAERFSLLALSPHGGKDLSSIRPAERLALVLGTEGEGLPNAVLQRLTTARIPMAAEVDSLNVATSAAISLYEIRRSV